LWREKVQEWGGDAVKGGGKRKKKKRKEISEVLGKNAGRARFGFVVTGKRIHFGPEKKIASEDSTRSKGRVKEGREFKGIKGAKERERLIERNVSQNGL